MASNPNFVGDRRKLQIANRIILWLFLGLSAFVLSLPIEAENPYTWQSQTTDDAITISGRDLSPEILAGSVPVTTVHNGDKGSLGRSRNDLLLRSSSSNVTGIRGIPLHALPIMASDLSEILLKTQADLKSHKGDGATPFYRFDTSHWSFLVNMASTNLHYGAIQAVVARLLKLTSKNTAPEEVVSTRVGVLLDDTIPIADIAIMPCRPTNDSDYQPFANFGSRNISESRPNEVFEVSPSGSRCIERPVNETSALAPFLNQDSGTRDNSITPRSIEAELLAPLAQTVYQMGYRLWQDPVHGVPTEVKAWAIKGLCYVGAYLGVVEMLRIHPSSSKGTLSNLTYKLHNGALTIDTGDYMVGNMLARLLIESLDPAPRPDPLTAMMRLNMAIVYSILEPLERMDPQENVFAMEGEIYGPRNVTFENATTRVGEKEVVAKWQISIRDKDEL